MQNLTESPGNATSTKNLSVIVKICMIIPVFFIFLYYIILMLHTFASHRQFLESSRYILFAYMLINDTLQLHTSVLLFLFVNGRVHFAIVYCAPLLVVSTATFLNTPLILAAMSLERYVAIFYPLHCPAAWRADHIWVIILILWVISCVLPTADFLLGWPRPGVDVLSTPVVCQLSLLNNSPTQKLLQVAFFGALFGVVVVLILFTYIRILVEARRARQERASSSAGKALHTVLLHGLQLLLSITAFTIPITEQFVVQHTGLLREYIAFLNYFCFGVLPRLLSPLIYGLRDERLRGHLKRAVLCCSTAKVSSRSAV